MRVRKPALQRLETMVFFTVPNAVLMIGGWKAVEGFQQKADS